MKPLGIFYVTACSMQQAMQISQVLLQLRLIACCNMVQDVTSVYKWQGTIQNTKEVLMMMKSRQELAPQIQEQVNKLHSYDVPEVICVPIVAAGPKYAQWIIDMTQPQL